MSREAPLSPDSPPLAAEDLPLFDLFQDLRAAGLPLGTADYLELLRALRLGEGIADRAALLRLCQLLWAGTRDEARLVERLADRSLQAAVTTPEPVAEPVAEPTAEPVAQSIAEPIAGPVAEPIAEPTAEPAAEPIPSPAPEVPVPSARGRAMELSLAILAGASGSPEPISLHAVPLHEYLPVSPRQMRQAWRRLRRMERHGPRTEPDLDATVTQVARDGVFMGATLVARRTNAERLLLFIDRDGSMVPFQVVARRLVDTARRGGRLAHVGVWYFHNTPAELDAGLAVHPEDPGSDLVRLHDLLARSPRSTTGALIVSDAGAARRTYSSERLEVTRRFLAALHAHLRRVAWLNPVPRDRWPGTTAQPLGADVPMFEADRAGLDAALRVLRGRRPHPQGAP